MLIEVSRLIVLLILLHPGTGTGSSASSGRQTASRRTANEYDADSCQVGVLGTSTTLTYITAFYRSTTSGLECRANVTSSATREVHVISLAMTSAVGSRDRARIPQIQLHIIPDGNQSASYSGKPLTFVLSSTLPVKWRIKTERISPQIQLTFWYSNGSQVMRISKPNMKTHRFALESNWNSNDLIGWTRRKFGHVTTVSEPPFSKQITRTVGYGPNSACVPSVQTTTPRQLRGCVARWNEGVNNKDVHIIELHSAGLEDSGTVVSNTSDLPVVEIHIHPKKLTTSQRRHLLLVLKLHQPVMWKIRTTGLRGTLDLVTDHAVDTNDIDMQSVRVVMERLTSFEGRDLIAWTADKYGPPVSYADAQAANFFDLVVDGADHLPKMNPSRKFGNGGLDTGDRWPNAAAVEDLLRMSVQQSRLMFCDSEVMRVTLNKRMLTAYGIDQNHVSLIDRSCHPIENSTHYLWTTKPHHCGTRQHRHVNRITYENSIIITIEQSPRPPGGFDTDDTDYSGSGQGEGREDDELLLDEDLESNSGMVAVDFSCNYSTVLQQLPRNTEYHLTVFRDANYQHRILSFPVNVNEKQRLFVEANITSSTFLDPNVQVLIENCSVLSNSGVWRQHHLIVQGCRSDKTVQWKDGELTQSQRFEFLFQKYWEADWSVTLQCDVTQCSYISSNNLPLCVTKDRQCVESNIETTLPSRRRAPSVTLSLGPLVLRLADQPPDGALTLASTSGVSSQGISLDQGSIDVLARGSTRCGQSIHVEGLDSLTVVCISFTAFVIGALLTGVLWFIYSRTVTLPRKRRQGQLRSVEASGESTPCSTAPITVHQVQRQI